MAEGLHPLNLGQMLPGSDTSVGQGVDSTLFFQELPTWLGSFILHMQTTSRPSSAPALPVHWPSSHPSPHPQSFLIPSGERDASQETQMTQPLRGDPYWAWSILPACPQAASGSQVPINSIASSGGPRGLWTNHGHYH